MVIGRMEQNDNNNNNHSACYAAAVVNFYLITWFFSLYYFPLLLSTCSCSSSTTTTTITTTTTTTLLLTIQITVVSDAKSLTTTTKLPANLGVLITRREFENGNTDRMMEKWAMVYAHFDFSNHQILLVDVNQKCDADIKRNWARGNRWCVLWKNLQVSHTPLSSRRPKRPSMIKSNQCLFRHGTKAP